MRRFDDSNILMQRRDAAVVIVLLVAVGGWCAKGSCAPGRDGDGGACLGDGLERSARVGEQLDALYRAALYGAVGCCRAGLRCEVRGAEVEAATAGGSPS